MLDSKYVVVKTEDYEVWASEWSGEQAAQDFPPHLPDCFVLRKQDVFAAPALHGYAHVIQSTLELDAERVFLTDIERSELRRLADELVTLATEWTRDTLGKIPD